MRKEQKHLKPLFDTVRKDLDKFDSLLERDLYADSDLVQNIIDHLLEKRGKRLRPTFLFLTARCCGMTHRKMVEAALSIELIHTATLLHDDVVDQADRRRGQSTVNAEWTNTISVLMGDFLFAKAFRLLVSTKCPKLIERVAETTEIVSVGELRQIEECGNFDLSEDTYLDIIAAKTASLFATSAAAGPLLNKSTSREVSRLAEFGKKVGISFQIADDLLDLVGDVKKTGKEVGNDLVQGKATLPLIHALRTSSRKVRDEITAILSNGSRPSHYRKVVDFIGNSGGIEYARASAARFGEEALKLIHRYGKSRYYNAIEEVVNFTVNREN